MTDATTAVEAAAPTIPAAQPAPTVPSDADGGRALESKERGELTTGTPTPHPEDPDKPTRDDPKSAWLAWARTRGYDRDNKAITKDQLIADYGA